MDQGRLSSMALFLFIAALIAADLVQDWRTGTDALHLGLEGAAMVAGFAGALITASALWRARGEAESNRRLAQVHAREAQRWRAEAETHLRGLGEAIAEQFARWQLSPAEAEVGLLLLKGLSTKEIGDVRGTSDKTVRQQARALYAKAGLAGRAELSAFFLEDLLLPR